jgi:hypothetical protein
MRADQPDFNPEPNWMHQEVWDHLRSTELRVMTLRWQKDIIEQWLEAAPTISVDSRVALEEMLSQVKRILAQLDRKHSEA